ncbi:MAG: serine/threonine protein kinase [Zavarzinella sp.]|nr:serine/threonine protein kinase [Zavarzinella sp.]
MAPVENLGDFCALVLKSELVPRPTLDTYLTRLKANGSFPTDVAGLAGAAIRDGLLTEFQARLIMQGKWRNFFLGGKYKVLEPLGAGGMGTVFLCEHRHMRRRVAVKVLPPGMAGPDQILQFQREAQAVAMLDHPNIVRAFDVSRDGGLNFLVMEYIDGASLQYLVDSRGPLPIPRAVNYVAQAALGLQHAHENGLVHRDVKPSNLMLDWAGTVKVLDLGLARFAKSPDHLAKLGDSKTVLGTADYLAPEQALSSNVDGRADVYGLGAVAFFLLAGKPPFDGGGVAQKLIRHQTEQAPRVNDVRSDVPAELADVVARMLAKEPAARPQTPAGVIAELRPWVVDVPPPRPEEMPPARYAPETDVDTKARHSTMALVSKSSRALLHTMMGAAPDAGPTPGLSFRTTPSGAESTSPS